MMMNTTTKGDFILAPGEKFVQCPYNQSHIVTNAKIIQHLSKCRKGYEKECEKAGKRKEMLTCNFNSNHKVLAPEIEFHHKECADRFYVVQTISYHGSDKFKRKMDNDERRNEKILKNDDVCKMDDDKRGKGWDSKRHGDKDFSKDYGHAYKVHDEESVDNQPKSTADGISLNKESIWGEYAEDWDADAKGYEAAYNPKGKLQAEVILYQPWGLTKSEKKQYRSEQKLKASRGNSSRKDGEHFGNFDLKVGDTFGTLKETPLRERNEDKVKYEPFIANRKPPPKIEDLSEKEDGECSDDDYEPFMGEDPFS